jgi:hypothetical protein
MRFLLALALFLPACATSWSDADTQASTIGAKNEARVLEMCASDDAGVSCSPSRVRAFTSLAFCAQVRELTVHGAPVPDAGIPCRP